MCWSTFTPVWRESNVHRTKKSLKFVVDILWDRNLIISTWGPVSGTGSEGHANMVRVSCADELNPIQYYLGELNAGELLREAQLQFFIGRQTAPLGPTP